MKIPIFTDEPGWHGAQLKQAFARQGVEAIFVSLQQCITSLSNNTATIQIPHFDQLPPAAFVRGVSGGTIQQVITRLNILHMLQSLGVMVYNDAKAIERTVDKTLTNFLLNAKGIPTPQTWVCESRHAAQKVREDAVANRQTLLIKPLFGSQGLGVRQLLPEMPLPVPMEQFVDGVYYLQAFIETPDKPHDYRLFVVHGKVIGAMRRIGTTWLNNVAAGGKCESFTPTDEMVAMAEQSADVLEMHYAGVDIIQSKNQENYVLEVNSIPAWRGLQRTTQNNLTETLVEDFLSYLN